MPWVGFEPTIPASEQAKIFHALDGAATVTGFLLLYNLRNTATLNKTLYADHIQGYGKMWMKMEYKTCLRFEVLVKIHIVFFLVMMRLCESQIFERNFHFHLHHLHWRYRQYATRNFRYSPRRLQHPDIPQYQTHSYYKQWHRQEPRICSSIPWTCALRTNTVRRTCILRDLCVSLLSIGADTSKYSSGVRGQCLLVADRLGDIWCEHTRWKYSGP
jgi:hypothetical protein